MNHSPKTTIHVTSIPSHLDRADLKKTFAQYPGFTRISFHADYCFACFEDVDSSTKAIDRIHQTTDMLAAYAKHGVASNTTPTIAVQPNPILYVSVFPYFTEAELVKIFKSYEGFDSTRFFPTHALVRFNSVENARIALEDLNSTTNLFANYSTKGAKNGFSRGPSSGALSAMGRSEEVPDRQGAGMSNTVASAALGGSGANINGVNSSVPRHTIHVTNIKLSKLGLKDFFSTMTGFRKIAFYQDYCFVIFDDVKAAAQAIEDILFKTKMKANFAKAEFTPHPPPSVGQANSIIRISDFPPNTTDNDLYEFFESYECFQDIQYYHASCLVYFDDVASARKSLEDINATTNFTAIYSKKGMSSAAAVAPTGTSKPQSQIPSGSVPPSSPPFVESDPIIHSKSQKPPPPRRLSITSGDTISPETSHVEVEDADEDETPLSPEDAQSEPTHPQSPNTVTAIQQLSPDSAETLVAQLTTSAPPQGTGTPKFLPTSPNLGNQPTQGPVLVRSSQLDPNAPAFAQSSQAVGGGAIPREGEEAQKPIGFNSSLGNYIAGPPSMFMPVQLEGRGSSSTLNEENSQSFEDQGRQSQQGPMDGFHPYMIHGGYGQRQQQSPFTPQQLQMQPVFHQPSFQSQPGNPFPQSIPQQGQQQQQQQQQQQHGDAQRQQQRGQNNGPFLDESGMRPINEGMDMYGTDNYLALTSTSHVAQYSTIQTATMSSLKQLPPFQGTERMTGEMMEPHVHGAKLLLESLFLRLQTLERENEQLRGGQPKGRFVDGWYEPHQGQPHNIQQQHQQQTEQRHNAQQQQHQQLQLQQQQEQQQQQLARQYQQVQFGVQQRMPQQRGGLGMGISPAPSQDTSPLSPRASVVSPPPASQQSLQNSQRNIQMEFEQLMAENERLKHENMTLREELSRKNTDLDRMEALHRTVAAVTAGAGSTSPLIQPSNSHLMSAGTLGKPDWGNTHGTSGGLSSPPPSSVLSNGPSISVGTVNGATTVPTTNGVSHARSGTANGVAPPVSSGAQMSVVASAAPGNPHTLFLQHMQHPLHSHHQQHGIQQHPLIGHKFSNPVSPNPAVAASGPGTVNKPFPRLPTFSKW
ncbi:hypothetical protein BJ742DRAFT_135974 [Cladochytrium replicatum]|nr:hypothetical protein BJ742DRAFT_135974 [Cladochytrium replicatum]